MKTTLIVVSLLTPLVSLAECWTVTNLQGVSTRAAEGQAISKDGYSGQRFEINILDAAGSVTPSDMKCRKTSKYSIVCIESGPEQATVETWAIDPQSKTVVHTKSRSGFGPLDGSNLFVGRVVGSCGAR